MPRANRHFLPGLVWHLTHRCHQREFLLKFSRDRDTYLHWLYEARKRFGLCVLDYMVTSNHVHLLVKDTDEAVIARSMQLIAGRTAQAYNQRKARLGAFWEDRYHATAIETGAHLHRCLVYIDLNMVRAGAVSHPEEWSHSGFREIQQPPERYRIIDLAALRDACGFEEVGRFQRAHLEWVAAALDTPATGREAHWSESIAVGGDSFVEQAKRDLDLKARHRRVAEAEGHHTLREPENSYEPHFDTEKGPLRLQNAVLWQSNFDVSEG